MKAKDEELKKAKEDAKKLEKERQALEEKNAELLKEKNDLYMQLQAVGHFLIFCLICPLFAIKLMTAEININRLPRICIMAFY